jgi:hypothetical protein
VACYDQGCCAYKVWILIDAKTAKTAQNEAGSSFSAFQAHIEDQNLTSG